jgi:hypothetical protein
MALEKNRRRFNSIAMMSPERHAHHVGHVYLIAGWAPDRQHFMMLFQRNSTGIYLSDRLQSGPSTSQSYYLFVS